MNNYSRFPYPSLYLVFSFFFLSGSCGLLYQTAWMRRLGLSFGTSHMAVTIVLSVFMSGLAIGYFGGSYISRKRKEYFRIYAILEIFIGLFGIASPFLINATDRVVLNLITEHSLNELSFLSSLSITFVFSFITLILPTIAMGATLPILSQGVVSQLRETGRSVSLLYGINTVGAVFGAFGGGLVLLPLIGTFKTLLIGGIVNCLIGIFAWIFLTDTVDSVPSEEFVSADKSKDEMSEMSDFENRTWRHRLLLPAYCIAGFISLSCEILWTRGLILSFGSSVYAFTIVLITFLSGLAVGSFFYPKIFSTKNPTMEAIGILQLFISFGIILSISMIGILPHLFLHLFRIVDGAIIPILLGEVLLSVSVLFLPTFIMGLLFPVIVTLITRHRSHTGKQVGYVGGVNTIGAVVGIFATGLYFLPQWGADTTLRILASLSLAIGALFLFTREDTAPTRSKKAALIVIVMIFGFFVSPWDPMIVSQGIFRYAPQYKSGNLGKMDILYFKDGWVSQVAVSQKEDLRSLRINGKVDGSDGEDMTTQIMLAELPYLMSEDPKTVFILGLGTGVTFNTALKHSPEKIVCLEIEERVLEAASFFKHVNDDVMELHKDQIIINDARQYLRTNQQTFDLIINEPSNPWIRGIANLFSIEFFELCKQRLSSAGIICQWLHLYGMSQNDVLTALHSFTSVFPISAIWQGSKGDILILGFKSNPHLSFDRIENRYHQNSDLLAKTSFANLQSFFDNFLVTGETLQAEMAPTQHLNTDDCPLLEFTTPFNMYRAESEAHIKFLRTLGWKDELPLGSGPDSPLMVPNYLTRRASTFFESEQPELAQKLLHFIYTKFPEYLPARYNLAMIKASQKDTDGALDILDSDVVIENGYLLDWGKAVIFYNSGDLDSSKKYCQIVLEKNPLFDQAQKMIDIIQEQLNNNDKTTP